MGGHKGLRLRESFAQEILLLHLQLKTAINC